MSKPFHNVTLTPQEMKVLLKYRKEQEQANIEEMYARHSSVLTSKMGALRNIAVGNREYNHRIVDELHEEVEKFALAVREYLKFLEDYPDAKY